MAYDSTREEICSKQPCGYSRMVGRPLSFGSQGEVESVTSKAPFPLSHEGGALAAGLKVAPCTVVPNVSRRSTAGGRMGREISTMSLSPKSEVASKRTFAPD